jgi:hypothetical protein
MQNVTVEFSGTRWIAKSTYVANGLVQRFSNQLPKGALTEVDALAEGVRRLEAIKSRVAAHESRMAALRASRTPEENAAATTRACAADAHFERLVDRVSLRAAMSSR